MSNNDLRLTIVRELSFLKQKMIYLNRTGSSYDDVELVKKILLLSKAYLDNVDAVSLKEARALFSLIRGYFDASKIKDDVSRNSHFRRLRSSASSLEIVFASNGFIKMDVARKFI